MYQEENMSRIKKDIRVNENEIIDRWKEYSMVLLHEHNDYEIDETAKMVGPLRKTTEVEVEVALKGMSERKAAGPLGLTSALQQAAGKVGIRDAMDCGNYRGVRLLEHGMKVYEYVLEKSRKILDIRSYQFRLGQGRSSTGNIFIVRQLKKNIIRKKSFTTFL